MNRIHMKEMVQLGIVVNNAEEAMKQFCEMFDVPEDYQILLHIKEGENGSRFTADFGWVNYAGIQFEFIQPISGDLATYQEYLRETGGGIHHIAFTSEDSGKLMADFRASGAKEITPGSDGGKLPDPNVGYFDFHKEMGLRFELSTKPLDMITKMSFEKMKK